MPIETSEITKIQDEKIRIGQIMKNVAILTMSQPEIVVTIESFLRTILQPKLASASKESLEDTITRGTQKLINEINQIIKSKNKIQHYEEIEYSLVNLKNYLIKFLPAPSPGNSMYSIEEQKIAHIIHTIHQSLNETIKNIQNNINN